ncbi:MAG: hypothetical protein AAB320_04860 [Elusimicrobiota bacterium]
MKSHAAALSALLLLSLAGYGFLLRPGQAPYTPFSDFLSFGLASKTVLYDSLHSGQGLPLWRSDQFSGNAALIDPQNAYTSPLNALFWLLPPLKALGPSLWLYFLAAGVIGYAAGCALQAGLWARLFMGAAAMFQFKLIIIGAAGWLPSFPGVIVLPLLYAAVLRAVERPRISEALWLGLAGALCLHSGHLQLLFYSVLALTCLVAARLRSRAVLTVLLAGMVLAAGLSACLLIPLAGEAPLISRGQASYDFFLGGHALTPRHLLTFLRPELLGNPLDGTYPGLELWEDVAYFGIIPLALALAAAILGRRRPMVRALTAALLVCAALSLRSPLQRLLFETLPGFSLFRLPGRLLFLGSWFGIALAGLGLDEILARLKSAAARRALALTLVSLISIEGAYYARRYLKTAPIERLLPAPSYRDFFAEQKGVYRIAPIERGVINYGWSASLGLPLITGYGSYNYNHYQAYFDLLRWNKLRPEGARVWTDLTDLARPDLLDALGVRFLISEKRPLQLPKDPAASGADLKDQPIFELYRGLRRGDTHIRENRGALGRAFFVDGVRFAADQDQAVALLQKTDARKEAVIESLPQESTPGAGKPSRVEVLAAKPGSLELLVSTPLKRYLAISEVWHPGWRATLGGAALPLYKTDVALLGAWVPPGEHRLSLHFEPVGWRLGLAVTAASLVFLLVAALAKIHESVILKPRPWNARN